MASSVKRNFAYNVAYQVLAIVLPLVTSPYLSRALGASNLGVYSYTYSIAYYFFLFAKLGVDNYGNREVARARGDRARLSRAFWSIWALQAALGLVAVAAFLAYALLGGGSYSPYLVVWAMYVLSAALDVNWLFFGLEEFRVTVTRNFVVKLATFALTFVVVRGPNALMAYVALMSASYLVSVAVLWPFVRSRVGLCRPRPREVLAHVRPNLVLFVPVIAVSLYTVLDKVMLGAMSSMEQTGFFDSAYKVASVPFTLVTALGTVMLPRMSHLVAEGRVEEGRRYTGASMWLAMAMSFAFAFGLAAVAPEFAPVFFGEGFGAVSPVMALVVAEMPFMAWANVIRTQCLIPEGNDRAYVLSVVAGAAANLAVNLAAIPALGALGAAVGTVAAEAAVCLVQTVAVRGELPMGRWARECAPFAAIGAVMLGAVRLAAGVLPTSAAGLCAEIALGAAVYALLSVAWCVLTRNAYAYEILLPTLRGMLGRWGSRG